MLLRVTAFACGVMVVVDAGAAQYYGRAGTPFATIAALMRWADMQTVRSSETVEIRISSWFGHDPAPLVRMIQANGAVRTEVILWWPSGNHFSASPWPSGTEVHCDAPQEGPQTCVKMVATDLTQDWTALFRDLRALTECKSEPGFGISSHTERLQLQISERGAFRQLECSRTDRPAGTLVGRTLKLLRDIATRSGY